MLWNPLYEYRADVINVLDGDTVELSIDVGLETRRIEKCRLYGMQAPERKGKTASDGEASRQKLRELLLKHSLRGVSSVVPTVICRTIKDKTEKYGRYLVDLIGQDGDRAVNINQVMIDLGFAVKWDGHGIRPDAAIGAAR